MQGDAINSIRFAAGLFEHYEVALGRAIDAARSGREPELEIHVADAERTARALADAVVEASNRTVAAGRAEALVNAEPPAVFADASRRLGPVLLERADINGAAVAYLKITGLRGAWPEVDWDADDGGDVDLFAGRRRKALVVGAVGLAGVAALTIYDPMTAAVVGMGLAAGWMWWYLYLRRYSSALT